MKKFTLTILLFLALGAFDSILFAQQEATCIHKIRHQSPSIFLQHIFNKYGVELSEKILLNLKEYEIGHNVFVLYSADYYLLMERMAILIQNATTQEEINQIIERKSKFVKFEEIENLLN